VDAPLWFFWTLQQYVLFTGDEKTVWEKYRKVMLKILDAYSKGSSNNIHVIENGLLYAGFDQDALTWMNAKIDNEPVVNRNGLAVEINALWYNAVKFYHKISKTNGITRGLKKWEDLAEKIRSSFLETFWDEERGYLADVVRGEYRDFTVRPNQLFACSLPYTILDDEKKHRILQVIESELLTPRGLRTLSPKNIDYKGIYKGDIVARDSAYHQGSAFPWLLGHFAEAYLNIHGRSGLNFIKNIYEGFESEMNEGGIGTISELYYGDPPYKGKGAISQAWSVAELLRMNRIIKHYELKTTQNQ
jgi:predicted glycogen debranching enzyme